MLPEIFRGEIDRYHKRWLAEVTGIPGNGHIGIDLLDKSSTEEDTTPKFGIEIKARNKLYAKHWAVNNEQVEQYPKDYPQRELFWAFTLYRLTKSVTEIKMDEDLEQLITEREIWFLPWDWIRTFPISTPKTGPYRYAAKPKFPLQNTFTTFQEKNGTLYIPIGSTLEKKLEIPF